MMELEREFFQDALESRLTDAETPPAPN